MYGYFVDFFVSGTINPFSGDVPAFSDVNINGWYKVWIHRIYAHNYFYYTEIIIAGIQKYLQGVCR